MIDELAKVIDVSLALSLHAPNDELRNQLVPINKKYPLDVVLDACQRYIVGSGREARADRRVHPAQGRQRPGRACGADDRVAAATLPCKINLIPFNPFPHSGYERPSNNAIRRFQDQLHQAGYQRHRAHHPW